MGRAPRCSKDGLNKGAWTAAEDKLLTDHVSIHGEGKWSNVAKKTGLKRCGKSCRLRWLNYLRPDIKRGNISDDEEELIIRLHKLLGNRWSLIAGRLPGRTDNEIKNYWNSNLSKKAQEVQLAFPKLANISVLPGPSQPHEIRKLDPSPTAGIGTYQTDQSSDTTTSGDDDSSDFLLDFNVEDFCQILDPPNCLTTDVPIDNHTKGEEGDGEVSYTNRITLRSSDQFPPKFDHNNNWDRNNECSQAAADFGSSDFMSLVSFLDSGVDWP